MSEQTLSDTEIQAEVYKIIKANVGDPVIVIIRRVKEQLPFIGDADIVKAIMGLTGAAD